MIIKSRLAVDQFYYCFKVVVVFTDSMLLLLTALGQTVPHSPWFVHCFVYNLL